MTEIRAWLTTASERLSEAGIDSARLDAELIACHVLGLERAALLAHQDQNLNQTRLTELNLLLERRLKREPLAYILGNREFYGRQFIVNKNVLIPRVESESFITTLRKLPIQTGQLLIDIGTGSGCLAITAALEFPDLSVTGWDVSKQALEIAKQNAGNLRATVTFMNHDLRKPATTKADFALANLPYVDRSWERSPETDYEPEVALFATDNGLHLIKALLASPPLHSGGYLLLEADARQHQQVIEAAEAQSFNYIDTDGLVLLFQLSK